MRRIRLFMDPDDWIERDLLKDNIGLMDAHGCDVVVFGHVEKQHGERDFVITSPMRYFFKEKRKSQRIIPFSCDSTRRRFCGIKFTEEIFSFSPECDLPLSVQVRIPSSISPLRNILTAWQ